MITTARMVTPGHAIATMPTTIAKSPRQRNEDDRELNIENPFLALSLAPTGTRLLPMCADWPSTESRVRVLVSGLPQRYNDCDGRHVCGRDMTGGRTAMRNWLTPRARLSTQIERLLTDLGPTDADVAATLTSAGVKGTPRSDCGSALARYLNAVVAFDTHINGVLVGDREVTVRCTRWWLRNVVVPSPSSVRRFMFRFDNCDYVDLLAFPADPGQASNSETG
jgi:hypothetical protein